MPWRCSWPAWGYQKASSWRVVCNPKVEPVAYKVSKNQAELFLLLVNSREEMVLHIETRRQSPNDGHIDGRALRHQPALAAAVVEWGGAGNCERDGVRGGRKGCLHRRWTDKQLFWQNNTKPAHISDTFCNGFISPVLLGGRRIFAQIQLIRSIWTREYHRHKDFLY